MTELEQPSISVGFGLLAKSTELSLREYTLITQSQADIERHLAQHLSTFSTVLYGAFSRKTIVSPLAGSIVDMLVVFREADVKNILPSRVFKKLSESLIKQYPDAYVLEGQNILMLPVKNVHYKIRPAYSISEHTYMLPAEKFNEWVKYDITLYNEIFVKENVRHKGKLIEIIRMIKTWNRVSGNLFNGYYLELLVTAELSSYQITSYSETLCHVFSVPASNVAFQKEDPASVAFQIEGLNDIDDLITAMLLLKKSFRLANEAIMFEQDGKIEKALDNWNQLFPQVFPTQIDMIVAKARAAGIKGADALRMLISHKK
jgi:hypothetical protein